MECTKQNSSNSSHLLCGLGARERDTGFHRYSSESCHSVWCNSVTIDSKKDMPFCILFRSRLYLDFQSANRALFVAETTKTHWGDRLCHDISTYVTAGFYRNDPECSEPAAAEGIQWLRQFYDERKYYIYMMKWWLSKIES